MVGRHCTMQLEEAWKTLLNYFFLTEVCLFVCLIIVYVYDLTCIFAIKNAHCRSNCQQILRLLMMLAKLHWKLREQQGTRMLFVPLR